MAASLIGQSLGRYHILEQLGEGGMATVYKAYDTRLETDVAVKVIRVEELPPKVLDRALKRFEREAKALAKLNHLNIVKVSDYGEYEGSPYLVMPYLSGGTLKHKLAGKPVSWQDAIKILVPVARALDYAHRQGMIHRDVKPSNILITEDGDPLLTDFGIAKIIDDEATLDLTGTSATVGTPEYMAPEQATAKTVDHRADIYALGVVLYEMVTGRKPYTADTPMAVLIMHARDPLPSPQKYMPGLPGQVEKLLLKALAKNPADRYQSMADFANAMELLSREQNIPSPAQPARRPERATRKPANGNLSVEERVQVNSAPARAPADRSASTDLRRYWPIGAAGGLIILGLTIALILTLGRQSGSAANPAVTEPPVVTATQAATAVPEVRETVTPTVAAPFPLIPGGFLERAVRKEFAGTTVIVDGRLTAPDDQKMKDGWRAFEDATGITVKYMGDQDFDARLTVDMQAGNAPDIADLVLPSQAYKFAGQGLLIDVSTFIPENWLARQYNQSWLDMAKAESPTGPIMTGVFNRFSPKSLVWYPKDDFEAAGYKVPQTWDEMLALSDQMAGDDRFAWCIGIESGAATGWPATDWMEDIMLRTTSLENYDKWVTGALPFYSPEVNHAAEIMGNIWFDKRYVHGGRNAITKTFFGDSQAGLFTNPPQCWLHRQATFIVDFFPPETKPLVDYGFFYLPPIDEQYGRPFLVSADMYVMFNDRPEVRALMEYFTLHQSVSGFMQAGGAFAAQKTATPDMYSRPLDASIAELFTTATSFRFDGSDMMPSEVGTAFWKGMTDWVSGTAPLDQALARIDVSWPK